MSEIDHNKRASEVVQSLVDLDDPADILVVLRVAVAMLIFCTANNKADALSAARVFGADLRDVVKRDFTRERAYVEAVVEKMDEGAGHG